MVNMAFFGFFPREKFENSYFNKLRYLNTDKNRQANLPTGVG